MPKRKQPPAPEMITLENHLTIEDWRFRVNFTESDVRRFSEGIVPEWFQQDCIF